MTFEFRFPDVGEGIHEGEIVRWLVAKGDSVAEDQPLVEVQTDKAVVEIPSPVSGVVSKLHYEAGEIIKVGSVIITLDTGADRRGPAAAGKTGKNVTTANDRAEKKAAASRDASTVKGVAGSAGKAEPFPAGDGQPLHDRRRQTLATPATRRLARELGVDVRHVTGSGPGGRVTDEDVRAFAAVAPGGGTGDRRAPGVERIAVEARAVTPVATPGSPEERVPLRGIRRRIAETMVRAKFTAPHATHVDEVDVTELVRLRQNSVPLAEERGIRLTYLSFILKAVACSLREFPYFNASLDEQAQEIVLKRYYHIGVATDTEQGLIVPVVRNVDQKSILQLAAEIADLAEQARQGRLGLEQMRDGTFTVTNVGALGGLFSTPILHYPEVGILGVHRIRERPVVREGQIVPRHMLTMAVSFDHRVVDGAYAARFLNRVMRLLEQPSLLLLELI